VGFEPTSVRLWKRLTRDERLAASAAFWEQPPEALLGSALAAIVKARHLRPQVARSLPLEDRVRSLAAILDPGETVSAALLVALHLGERRPLLSRFLDALRLPHEDGILKEDESAPVAPLGETEARDGVAALRAQFPESQVVTYLNTLWLQDPERWAVLERSPQWLGSGG